MFTESLVCWVINDAFIAQGSLQSQKIGSHFLAGHPVKAQQAQMSDAMDVDRTWCKGAKSSHPPVGLF